MASRQPDLRSLYATWETPDLLDVADPGSGYTAEAMRTARQILSGRGISDAQIAQHAKACAGWRAHEAAYRRFLQVRTNLSGITRLRIVLPIAAVLVLVAGRPAPPRTALLPPPDQTGWYLLALGVLAVAFVIDRVLRWWGAKLREELAALRRGPEIHWSPPSLRMRDLPDLVRALEKEGEDGDFAALMVRAEGKNAPPSGVVIQYSVEQGRVGFDWVLLSPENLQYRERVEDFFRRRGVDLEVRTENDVSYLRSEDVRSAALGQALLNELLQVTDDEALELVAGDMEWPADLTPNSA